MKKISFQVLWIRLSAILVLLVAGFPIAQNTSAQAASAYVYVVREIELAELEIEGIEGLAYSAKADALLAIQSANNGVHPVAMIDRTEELLGVSVLQSQSVDTLSTAFNDQANSLFTVDPATQELTATPLEQNGAMPDLAVPSKRFNLRMGLQRAQGMDFDPGTGRLFILDPAGKRMWIVTPDADGNYDGDTALRNNRVKRVNLGKIENGRLHGLAYNPDSGNLFTLNEKHNTLYEITENGDLVSTRDLSSFSELQSPSGMVFAPSGDTTDNPETKSLYIADPSANTIVELSITAVEIMALPAESPISLVNTILTSNWNPPSPDASGIDYDHLTNRLLLSDSEVEEMSIYKGKNVFGSSLGGSLQSTCVTTAFTKEPSGLAVDPDTGRIFFADDSKRMLHQVDRGADGQYCTSDDQVRTANMATYGVQDPEGIGFGAGHLFIADGTNAEVWRVSPGPNGFFDGAGSAGDDVVVSHFDTAGIGLRDPEGIDYHPSRGTLFIISRRDKNLVEASLTGEAVRVFNISFLNAVSPAGIGIGPGSNNSSALNIYLAARGVDNNSNPNENDGKIYELNVGDGSGPTLTPTPITPTPTATPTGPVTDLIFADGFEAGNLSAWSSAVGGDLSVSSTAALVGTRGLQVLINDNTATYLIDESPVSEAHYRARFYFDPNSISMASSDNHFIFYGYSGTSKLVTRIQFRFTTKYGYQVRAHVINNSSSWTQSAWLPITDAPHALEIDWVAATSGGLTLWIDGTQVATITGINNSNYRIERVRFGAVNAIDSGTRGTYYFDAFESRRQTYIGP